MSSQANSSMSTSASRINVNKLPLQFSKPISDFRFTLGALPSLSVQDPSDVSEADELWHKSADAHLTKFSPLFTGMDTRLTQQYNRVRTDAIERFEKGSAALKKALSGLGCSEEQVSAVIAAEKRRFLEPIHLRWNEVSMSPGVTKLANDLWAKGQIEDVMMIGDLSAALGSQTATCAEDIKTALSYLRDRDLLATVFTADTKDNAPSTMLAMSLHLTDSFMRPDLKCQSPTANLPSESRSQQICAKCADPTDTRPHYSELRQVLHDAFRSRKSELIPSNSFFSRGDNSEHLKARVALETEYTAKRALLWYYHQTQRDPTKLREVIEELGLQCMDRPAKTSFLETLLSFFSSTSADAAPSWTWEITSSQAPEEAVDEVDTEEEGETSEFADSK